MSCFIPYCHIVLLYCHMSLLFCHIISTLYLLWFHVAMSKFQKCYIGDEVVVQTRPIENGIGYHGKPFKVQFYTSLNL